MPSNDSTSARAPELKHVCGLQGFGRGADGLFDRCPACEAPATPPRDETPPTPRELRTVAGELPGVGRIDFTARETWLLDEVYRSCAEAIAERNAEIAALRLRAEAAERQLAAFTQDDVDFLGRCADGWDGTLGADDDDRVFLGSLVMRMRDVRHLASLAARIAATLSSQRTL